MSSAIATKIESIRKKAGISLRDVAQLLKTTPETVSRWRNGRSGPQPDSFKKIATLAWLVDELAEFYEPGEARMWLFTPHRLLGGKRPADAIEEDRLDDVWGLIKQLQDGAFV